MSGYFGLGLGLGYCQVWHQIVKKCMLFLSGLISTLAADFIDATSRSLNITKRIVRVVS